MSGGCNLGQTKALTVVEHFFFALPETRTRCSEKARFCAPRPFLHCSHLQDSVKEARKGSTAEKRHLSQPKMIFSSCFFKKGHPWHKETSFLVVSTQSERGFIFFFLFFFLLSAFSARAHFQTRCCLCRPLLAERVKSAVSCHILDCRTRRKRPKRKARMLD